MKCPGQDPRYWKFDAIFDAKCPNCGAVVEFFKDETRRRCKGCGQFVLNPKMDFGCATHCKFAEHCFGDLPPELIKQKEDLFKDRVAIEMKLHLKRDFKRIGHASRVAGFVQRLAQAENGDPAVALSVAYLNEIVDSLRESPNGKQGIEVVKDILDRLDAAPPLAEEVCAILEQKKPDSVNFKVFHDALKLAEIEQQIKKSSIEPDRATDILNSGFVTASGKEAAGELLGQAGA